MVRALLGALTLCAIAALPAPVPADDAAKAAALHILVGTPATDQTMSLIYAVKSGMFARAGLDVQLDHSAPNGAAIAAGVASGSFDVGNSVVTSLFDAHQRGLPFLIVGVGAVYDSKNPYSGMIVPADSPIHSVADFKSGVVGLAILHDVGQLAITKAVSENGGSTKDLQFTEIPQPAGLAAVQQHRVEATELSNPILAQAVASGMRLIPDLDVFGKSFTFTAYFVTKSYATQHAAAIKTFARVLAQAARYTNGHPADTAQLLAGESTIPLAVIQKMPRVMNGTSLTPQSMQPLIDASAKYGFLSAPFPAQDLIDPDAEIK